MALVLYGYWRSLATYRVRAERVNDFASPLNK